MRIALPSLHSPAAYADSGEHLRDELARIELLVRAQYARWEVSRGPAASTWGMSFIGVEEIQNYQRLPHAWPESAEDVPAASKLQEQATALRQKIDQRLATTRNTGLRWQFLRENMALDPWAADLLLFTLLPEFDPRFRRLYGFLQNDAARTRPTLELAWSVLRPLRATVEEFCRWIWTAPAAQLLFQPLPTSQESWWTHELILEERIVQYLLGVDQPDRRIAPCVTVTPRPSARPEHLAPFVLQQLQAAARAGAHLFFLQGDSGCGQRETAALAAASLCKALLEVDSAHLLALPGGVELAIDRIYREALLARTVVFWRDAGPLAAHEEGRSWKRLLQRALAAPLPSLFATPVGVDSRNLGPVLSFAAPDAALREALWRHELGDTQPELAHQLSGAWQLSHDQIAAAARGARQEALQSGRAVTPEDFSQAARRQNGHRLAGLARRFEPSPALSLASVVLPPRNQRQLQDFAMRAECHRRYRTMAGGQHSLIALFTGPSGTGKTLSAHAIASQHKVDLYRIDLAGLVSKYVGETEKNLDRVFREAEGSNAMLFFDEADAMFGRRGRIQQAQDRWANLEVNFLLQRVEDYDGIVVLATNLRDNIDDAFSRRIQVFVDFPPPDESARLAIWQRLLPAHALSPASFREVARRFPLAGGSILNAATDARCRALAAGAPEVLLGHVITAIGREYQKCDKPLTRNEFGEEFYAVIRREILLEE